MADHGGSRIPAVSMWSQHVQEMLPKSIRMHDLEEYPCRHFPAKLKANASQVHRVRADRLQLFP